MKQITDIEFAQFQRFIFDAAGITLPESKKQLVTSRLFKRLNHWSFTSFSEYLQLLNKGGENEEIQTAVDLLTTNETYFFREMKHFDFLRQRATAACGQKQPFRVWSAASSSGEEAYSIAMVLADCLGNTPWEVIGSDISTRVLQRASRGHYPLERTSHIPPAYLQRFCLKGIAEQHGTLLVDRNLRSRVHFQYMNLNVALPQIGMFDVIFLRNVMIYFSNDTKRQVVARVLSVLQPGGHFCVGHAESLNDISTAVSLFAPSIYVKA